jgi:multidrug efflux pump subunit AcrA (membrane-fusion protein)
MGAEVFNAGNFSSVGTGLQVAGVLGSTLGAYNKSSLEKQGYAYESAVARSNAQLAEYQAADAIVRGQTTENNVRQKTAQLKGTQRASFAARGIDMGSGSALDILTSTDYMGERDALLARDNAGREAWGHTVEATNYTNKANAATWRGNAQSPFMDAASTLLTGAGSVASRWYSLANKKGGPVYPNDTSIG